MGMILLIFKKCFSLIFLKESLKILMIREIKLFQFIIVL